MLLTEKYLILEKNMYQVLDVFLFVPSEQFAEVSSPEHCYYFVTTRPSFAPIIQEVSSDVFGTIGRT